MNEDQQALLSLFERPFEPLKVPRNGGKLLFQLELLEGEDSAEEEVIALNFGDATRLLIPADMRRDVKNKIYLIKQVQPGAPFSHFNNLHMEAAKELTTLFMSDQIIDEKMLWQVAASIKNEEVNEGLFIYALSYAIIKKTVFDSRLVPAIYEVFPTKFIPQYIIQDVWNKLRSDQWKDQETSDIVLTHKLEPLDLTDFTGTDLNPEHRVAYWREDYGLNAHHWHWHLVYPLGENRKDKEPRDRKGEIFFYMHNQMMARYDWERLSNKLNRVVKYNNWREPIPEGYFPKLTVDNSSRHYGNRPDNMTPQDITRIDKIEDEIIPFDINDMERWRDRLYDAIHKGFMKTKDGVRVPLSDNADIPGHERGINILGNTFEADGDLSVNEGYYGQVHNFGHVMLALIHDPHGYHKEDIGVMGSADTACRDPVFWRWHKFVDDIFQTYKMEQVPYKKEELVFDSLEVESVSVQSGALKENILHTGWDEREVDASRGLDFRSKDRKVLVKLQHLTHRPFTYNIQVTNNQTVPVDVTVRLYMAPKLNEAEKAMTFMDQRLLWGEMDKYKITLEPGLNSLERLSTESSITTDQDWSFQKIEEYPLNNEDIDPGAAYCGCGWPQHLLLPMGRKGGMEFQIFVLISCWELDKVDGSSEEKSCSNAASYCGILDEKFPDSRPMGYPFDRRPNRFINDHPEAISNVTEFANALPNAAMTDITIEFHGNDIDLNLE